ncbi:MAG: methylmalonyl Co-A mutase-associated GTPase MeaB [Candidatus Omnitrophota bacterium]
MSDTDSYSPDWAPANGGDAFAVRVKKGIEKQTIDEIKNNQACRSGKKRLSLTVSDYVNGVLKNDKTILARTITLIESNCQEHYDTAREVLKQLLPYTGNALRIGITGVPGAGKSTLIEALGCRVIEKGHKVAVLAVDPSSTVTRGSILGDKTRMEKLSRQPNCFIRPSPSGGTLGGVTRKSRETILVCEAAGYDTILVETVGVGQSEITVRSMVDFFLLVLIAGAGDELQGIKKGVMELADALLINKADGPNIPQTILAKNEYNMALKYMAPATRGWETRAFTCSALTGDGIAEAWDLIRSFERETRESGVFQERRQAQSVDWVFSMVESYLKENFYTHPRIRETIPQLQRQILNGSLLATTAAEDLLRTYFNSLQLKK